MDSSRGRPGLAGFALVWAGQLVSVLATQMTAFALVIWVYQRTSSVTALGLQEAFYITPFLLMTPLAGVLVDRHNRKLMMMVSDLGARRRWACWRSRRRACWRCGISTSRRR